MDSGSLPKLLRGEDDIAVPTPPTWRSVTVSSYDSSLLYTLRGHVRMLGVSRRRRPVGFSIWPSMSEPHVTRSRARPAARRPFLFQEHHESHCAPVDRRHENALQMRPADEQSFRSHCSVEQSSFPEQRRWETGVKYHKPACAVSPPPIGLFVPLWDGIHRELVPTPRDRRRLQQSALHSHLETQHRLAGTPVRSIVNSIHRYSGIQKTSHAGLTLSANRETVKWKHARSARVEAGRLTDSPDWPESHRQPGTFVYRSFRPSSSSSYPSCLRAAAFSSSAAICLDRALSPSLALSRLAFVLLWRGVSTCTLDSLSRAKARKKDRPVRRGTGADTIEDPRPDLSHIAAARRLREIWTLHRLTGVSSEQDLESPDPVRTSTQTGLSPRRNRPDANTVIASRIISSSAVSEGQEVTCPVHRSPADTRDGVSAIPAPPCNISAETSSPVSNSPTLGTEHLTTDSEHRVISADQLADTEREQRILNSSSRGDALFERYGTRNSAGTKAHPTRQRGVVVKVHRYSVCGFIAPEDGGPEIFVHRDDFMEPSASNEESPASLFISPGQETPEVGKEIHQQYDDRSSKNVGRRRRQRSAKPCFDQTERRSVEEGTLGGRVVEGKPIQLRVGQLLSFEAAWDGRHNAPKAVRVVSLEEFDI
ncbi:hypothetical protein CSUI_002740 [Cystoisospora suis]|uniref:CSD domain-containing protein n=1 Tax=Cystoisospora suis TaxID=483139 RepID=A0A2C6KH84_9APIC|nr:hypothetical protein CSUI_002740 [Cystoisospora suis]